MVQTLTTFDLTFSIIFCHGFKMTETANVFPILQVLFMILSVSQRLLEKYLIKCQKVKSALILQQRQACHKCSS